MYILIIGFLIGCAKGTKEEVKNCKTLDRDLQAEFICKYSVYFSNMLQTTIYIKRTTVSQYALFTTNTCTPESNSLILLCE